MHLTLAGPPSESDISTNMARLGALGLEVHVSEMDVRLAVNTAGTASAADLASQATLYQNVFAACQANSNCTAFLTWGVTDLYSWIPSSFPGFGADCRSIGCTTPSQPTNRVLHPANAPPPARRGR